MSNLPTTPFVSRSQDVRIEALAAQIAERHGALLTIAAVALELHRTEGALRFVFASRQCQATPWVHALQASKIRMGRRVFFPADVAAAVMLQGDSIRAHATL